MAIANPMDFANALVPPFRFPRNILNSISIDTDVSLSILFTDTTVLWPIDTWAGDERRVGLSLRNYIAAVARAPLSDVGIEWGRKFGAYGRQAAGRTSSGTPWVTRTSLFE